MPIEKGESGATEGAANVLQEIQERVLGAAADVQAALEDEAKKRQEAADMDDFRRQIRETAAAAEAVKARTYVVQPGDTLSAIAESLLGSASKWPAIFEANRDKLDNPDLIQVGQELVIP